MFSYLEKIGPIMIASLKSTEGIVVCVAVDEFSFVITEISVVFSVSLLLLLLLLFFFLVTLFRVGIYR